MKNEVRKAEWTEAPRPHLDPDAGGSLSSPAPSVSARVVKIATDHRAAGAIPVRPHMWPFLTMFLLATVLGAWSWAAREPGPVDAYVSVVWTLPTLAVLIALTGVWRTWRRSPLSAAGPVRPVDETLVVVVPTVGRADTVPALFRTVASMVRELPTHFSSVRVDVIVEQDCDAAREVVALAAGLPHVRVVTVPRAFGTAHGTLFKARAVHFAHLLRQAEGEDRPDVWVLHMDDDTAIAADTAAVLARFVAEQHLAGAARLHLCQGVLCYPRELAPNRLLWMADAVRPACDVGLFSATTGRGSPLAGLHGEMLLIRASVESAIGWDFGPRSLVEDAQFALEFSHRFPGRSAWVPACSAGASPATVRDFVQQRERWVWGLLELVWRRNRFAGRRIPLRHRMLMLHNVSVWSLAPLGHPLAVLVVCAAFGDFSTAPTSAALIPCWALNAAYCSWLYWEGMRLNIATSARPRRHAWEAGAALLLLPVLSLLEVAGIALGVLRFLMGAKPHFTVIAKPR
ncbi:MAG: glycosyltransferase family 2 protein [Intrasporangium sp.]|uniref:glycosyltransferase n=1 Tax=Intrasporangium sp. TaxID=1925024 RepID=UPI0026480421|nr:glycosyltransferase family 2 protein [Intrasporangium sp.]MDN5795000.1 glycosyltransferase family 2 protein [Intrasporangium sp.]